MSDDANEDAARECITSKAKPVLRIVCRNCDNPSGGLGGVYASRCGLLLILDHQRPRGRRAPLVRRQIAKGVTAFEVPEDVYSVFAFADQQWDGPRPGRCRCGHEFEVTRANVEGHVTANLTKMPV
jgi:hypothetical protein